MEGEDLRLHDCAALQKGTRVYWRDNAADSGIVSETSWDAVTITWDDGKVASVHHGDMREIQLAPATSRIGISSPGNAGSERDVWN